MPDSWLCLLLFLRLLSATLMRRRWRALARYEALALGCTIVRLFILPLPPSTPVLALDLMLFAIPTGALVLACEAEIALAVSALAIPPLVLLLSASSSDARRTLATFGIALIQGMAAAHAIGLDFQNAERSWERRAAAVLAMVAVLSMFFVDDWSNTVVAGCAAHVFILFAYFRHRPGQDRGDLHGVGGAPIDQGSPAAERAPRAEAVDQTEQRP